MGGHPTPQLGRMINSGTGRNKIVNERLQQVPQQTAVSRAPVQRTVIEQIKVHNIFHHNVYDVCAK